ncbi:MAG: glycosyltransferase family 4 protein [Bacteroidales bacterium]|nr:glycosyltransferase family 4 protein [Bacteroidales bacterium]
MKKALIITYYWPPSGGAGVQRWLKFAKYLREFGWEPVIYTPENPESPVIDPSLEKDIPEGMTILKTKIVEPYTAYKRFVGRKKSDPIKAGFLSEKKNPSLTEKISVWIRGNFFIPDARMFWIRPSIRFLTNYLKTNPVDVIISTGPPHSMHMIALGVKKATNLPWLADFRDPWTNIDFYDDLMLSGWADRKHKKQELEVLKNADEFVTVSWNWAKDFQKIYNRKIEVITNGFDPEDFPETWSNFDQKFSIVHIGAMNKDRNPHQLWVAISELLTELPVLRDRLEIKLIGSNDYSVLQSISRHGLEPWLTTIKDIPHAEVVKHTVAAQVLLLALNDTPNVSGIIPGKIFEYIASRRPILCIGPEDGDSARILNDTSAGQTVNFDDKVKIKRLLTTYFELYMKNDLKNLSSDFLRYSRKSLCGLMTGLLNNIAKTESK